MKSSRVTQDVVLVGRTGERVGLLLLVSGVTLLGTEFGDATFWFQFRLGGIPAQYFGLVLILLGLAPLVVRRPAAPMIPTLRESRVLPWLLLGGLGVCAGVLIGVWTNVPEPFVDWRNLLIMAVVVILAVRWLGERFRPDQIVLELAVVYGFYAGLVLINWFLGGGTSLLGQRIPIFDGAKLAMISFSSVVSLIHWISGADTPSRTYRWMVRAAGLASTIVVVLSFRRTYWLIVVVGVVGFFVFRALALSASQRSSSRWFGPLLVGLAAVGVATMFIGSEALIQRVQSFAPGSDNPLAATNQDHVNDVLDALDVIRDNPLLGYGIGREYTTQRIAAWKTESFEVHNAPVHVWLKFGLAGMIGYIGFHLTLIGRLLKRPPKRGLNIVWVSVGLFLAGEFVAALAGPWPYVSFQNSVFHAVLFSLVLSAYGRGGQGVPEPSWKPA